MITEALKRCAVFCTVLLITGVGLPAAAQDKPSFEDYVVELKQEAQQQGFSEDLINTAFDGVFYRKKAVTADRNQPEFKLTLDRYLSTRVPDWKVNQAIGKFNEHQTLLQEIGQEYGVQPRFIVALWGNESNFGKIQGKHPLISALSTLAYDGRREVFFKKQLFAALRILQEGHTTKEQLVGSWAGAMGQSQFMPTSFLIYAVDHDNDGKKDIWGNTADVFASIANYLSKEGWSDSITWGRQVTLPAQFDYSMTGLKRSKMKPLQEWQMLGVRRYDGSALPQADLKASLLMPDDENGRIYLVYENFHTLMKWNRSSYFGVSVSRLADKIRMGMR